MERLTGFWNGKWILSPEAQREGYDNYSVYSRLAAYEDIGLTPEQCAEYAQAEADGRLVEVVRCGECKFKAVFLDGHSECRIYPSEPTSYQRVTDSDYCGHGERREKE